MLNKLNKRYNEIVRDHVRDITGFSKRKTDTLSDDALEGLGEMSDDELRLLQNKNGRAFSDLEQAGIERSNKFARIRQGLNDGTLQPIPGLNEIENLITYRELNRLLDEIKLNKGDPSVRKVPMFHPINTNGVISISGPTLQAIKHLLNL